MKTYRPVAWESPKTSAKSLSPFLEAELRELFCVWEARIGVRSNFATMLATIQMAPPDDVSSESMKRARGDNVEDSVFVSSGTHVYRNPDVLLDPERVVDNLWASVDRQPWEAGTPMVELLRQGRGRSSWASRYRRSRGAVASLSGTGLDVVLWRLYGPACSEDGVVCAAPIDPIIRGAVGTKESDRYARVADLTSAAEDCRERWATEEGLRRESETANGLGVTAMARREDYERMFWQVAGAVARMETKLFARAARPRCKREITRTMVAKRDAWREVMRRCAQAVRYDGEVSARCTAMASADRETTASGALREYLRPTPPGLSRDVRDELEADRVALICRVRREAQDLINRASEAYREARELEFARDQ